MNWLGLVLLLAALTLGSTSCSTTGRTVRRATANVPATLTPSALGASPAPAAVGRRQLQALRITARRDAQLARQQTRQQKAAGRTQTTHMRVQNEQKRTEKQTATQLAKQQTAQTRLETNAAQAWARADLERAKAERKQAEALKLNATAANVRLGLYILAGGVVLGLVGWLVLRVRGLLKVLPLLALLGVGLVAEADDGHGRSRKRWRKSRNGRIHAVVPKHRRNIW